MSEQKFAEHARELGFRPAEIAVAARKAGIDPSAPTAPDAARAAMAALPRAFARFNEEPPPPKPSNRGRKSHVGKSTREFEVEQ